MKAYLVSLAVGLRCGVIDGLFDVRSPAPPLIALVGLLGILIGEQVPAFARHAAAHGLAASTTSHLPAKTTESFHD